MIWMKAKHRTKNFKSAKNFFSFVFPKIFLKQIFWISSKNIEKNEVLRLQRELFLIIFGLFDWKSVVLRDGMFRQLVISSSWRFNYLTFYQLVPIWPCPYPMVTLCIQNKTDVICRVRAVACTINVYDCRFYDHKLCSSTIIKWRSSLTLAFSLS